MFPFFSKLPDSREAMLNLPSHEESMDMALMHGEFSLITGYEIPSIHGKFGLSGTAFGVSLVFFPGFDEREVEDRLSRYERIGFADSGRRLMLEAGIELMEYLLGQVRNFETPVDVSFCPQFSQAVYRTLTRVPFGETITYGELAELAGHPGKARAVGRALANNPCPVFVPCHRVLSASGDIGGWSGPPGWKEELLYIEGIIDRPDAAAN